MLSVAPMLYMLNMYDRVMTSRSETTLISLTVILVATFVFWQGLEWIRQRMMIRISLRIDWELAADVFDASFRRFVGRKKINVHQVLGDLVMLRQFLTGAPLIALMSAPFAVFFIIFGVFFHPYLAVFSAVATALMALTAYLTKKTTSQVLREANEAQAESNRLAAQSLRNAETALALGMMPVIRKSWYERHQGYLQMQVHASEASGVMGSISNFLTKLLPSLQIAVGITLAIQGLITGGMVIAANFLISKSIGPLRQVLTSWGDIVAARIAYDRLNKLLADDEVKKVRMELPPPTGRLSVSELYVQPASASAPILNNINFSLQPGMITVVVGPSAAGKSSLLKALVGIWRPSKGSVRLDGAEISDWIQDHVGRYIGYMPQEIEFFEGTIAENIARLGEVDSDKVVKAAQLVGVHEMILSFPQGYDTKLGEIGHVLTGGQKQRIALARALYGDPCYIVMDEPNAALDEAGDRLLMQTMQKLKATQTTVIFTTHRAEYINMADNLLVLNAGKQTAFGPVADMLASARKLRDAKQLSQTQTPISVAQGETSKEGAAQPAAMPPATPKSPEAVTGAAA